MAVKEDTFQLKADLVPLTVIKLLSSDAEAMRSQLEQKLQAAPNYFRNAPLLLDISAISETEAVDMTQLVLIFKSLQLKPVAIRGVGAAHFTAVSATGLPIINSHSESTTDNSSNDNPAEVAQSEPKTGNRANVVAQVSDTTVSPTKIITKPIRAGSQVYAKGGDLIVLAAVNPGAECFADGSIHVYGPLRGRALAGVNGDEKARIFCRSLEAELVAIAGHYQVKDNMQAPSADAAMVQIYLDKEKICMQTI